MSLCVCVCVCLCLCVSLSVCVWVYVRFIIIVQKTVCQSVDAHVNFGPIHTGVLADGLLANKVQRQ